MKLSIIIVNYNVKFYLEQCLLSVEKAIHGIDAEVVVVDNHSKDGSVEHIEQRFPMVISDLQERIIWLLNKLRENMFYY